MKISLIYDNEVWVKGLESDWGFACLVEADNAPRILFDTGADGSILLKNMEKLDIDPSTIPEVFISHAHFDHTGGLSDFLKENKDARVYVPSSCGRPRDAADVVSIRTPAQIHENIFSTGELKGIEQSMVVRSGEGIVVIAGCSHPGVGTILEAASSFGKVYGLVGGLHGFRDFDLLSDLKYVGACHCTQYKSEISRLYPEKWVECGAGRVLEW
ncbi:MAG: MBL fold metallo-hydrolase [Dehalococcoidia bacterium]